MTANARIYLTDNFQHKMFVSRLESAERRVRSMELRDPYKLQFLVEMRDAYDSNGQAFSLTVKQMNYLKDCGE